MKILTYISDIIWGIPSVALILGVGIFLTVALRCPQARRLGEIFRSPGAGGSAFRALTTSLAATVGTGSVIGVASAIAIGGPGAVFWLWVSAFFGTACAYAEGVLSIRFRHENPREGGIWTALEDGLGAGRLAKAYAAFTVLASFGMGCMVQTSSAADAINSQFGISHKFTGIFCMILLILCLFVRNFAGKLCEKAVPVLGGIYIFGALFIILKNAEALPEVFLRIVRCAFGIKPIAGAAAGYGIKRAMSVGCRRGIFSNEAGLGTTAPVHAASDMDDPDRQGLMNILEVIIDTFVICTLTALAILCSGADKVMGISETEMVVSAAESAFDRISGQIVACSVAAFSIATAVGWSQIGMAAAKYLSGRFLTYYKMAYALSAMAGALLSLDAVFKLSDIFNGLMMVPCLTAIILLRGEVIHAERRKN